MPAQSIMDHRDQSFVFGKQHRYCSGAMRSRVSHENWAFLKTKSSQRHLLWSFMKISLFKILNTMSFVHCAIQNKLLVGYYVIRIGCYYRRQRLLFRQLAGWIYILSIGLENKTNLVSRSNCRLSRHKLAFSNSLFLVSTADKLAFIVRREQE